VGHRIAEKGWGGQGGFGNSAQHFRRMIDQRERTLHSLCARLLVIDYGGGFDKLSAVFFS
jgi:hypothetical protein